MINKEVEEPMKKACQNQGVDYEAFIKELEIGKETNGLFLRKGKHFTLGKGIEEHMKKFFEKQGGDCEAFWKEFATQVEIQEKKYFAEYLEGLKGLDGLEGTSFANYQ